MSRWGIVVAFSGACALSACGVLDEDDTVPCAAYACSTSATLTASVPCREGNVRFLVTLCHGTECSNGAIAWENGTDPVCTQDLVLSDPEGFDEQRVVCAQRAGEEILFEGRWDFGREGTPSAKEFSLRISDERSGEMLLDATRSATFEPGAWHDHCHDCLHASMPLGTSSRSCAER